MALTVVNSNSKQGVGQSGNFAGNLTQTYNPQPAAAAPSSGGVASGGGGGGGGGYGGANNYYAAAPPPIDTAAIAAFDQQINSLNQGLGRADANRNSGFTQIDATWQNALNQLLAGRNNTEKDVTTQRKQTADDFIGAKNTIGYNSGNQLNSILRLLGSKGAGGGSTAKISAPGGVAREATLQRNDVSATNAKNSQAIDSGWNKYLLGYNNEVSSANTQRTNNRDLLNRQIEESKAGILQQISALAGKRASAAGGNAVGAMQPYLDQANAALNRASNYTVNPVNYNTQAYTAPELSDYTIDPAGAPSVQGETANQDYVSPYYAGLLGLNRQEQGLAA